MSNLQATLLISLLLLIEIGICIYVSHCERDIANLTSRLEGDEQTDTATMLTVRWPDEYGTHWRTSIHPHELADLIREQPSLAGAIREGAAHVSIHPTTEGTLQ
ncbi:hypothetical protein [Bifidobacterium cuniculi]|uniref:Uncharacterized protein n=1 Tax=Bifidobacterium cuniculi TaxID=1688 RepID=A0A087B4G7_9BIFI|nr:hypothetical protein [Bifidobacterium cuniculi]KFI65917.1 hypothetical protein BCUN_0416 [Bifidobacterium cuniculi]